jgi:hypothetical protein
VLEAKLQLAHCIDHTDEIDVDKVWAVWREAEQMCGRIRCRAAAATAAPRRALRRVPLVAMWRCNAAELVGTGMVIQRRQRRTAARAQ